MELINKRFKKEPTDVYMGDDVPDVEVMKFAGISCCPADACRDVLEIADYISPVRGGEGCVRDVIEKVMRIQGKWNQFPILQVPESLSSLHEIGGSIFSFDQVSKSFLHCTDTVPFLFLHRASLL